MIDWHTHILPALDDGSRDVKESLNMLEALKEQGVNCVIATPHFLANKESVNDFLSRRARSFELLSENMREGLPQVLCGAEVKYYPGISRLNELELLTIDKKGLLLLEMPMEKWTEYTQRELVEIAVTRGLTVIIAHIERYMLFQNKGVIDKLCDNGLLMQVNAGYFNSITSRYKALRLLDSGLVHFIGSDCHNMSFRPPNISAASKIIGKRFGAQFLNQMNEFGYNILNQYD